MKRRQIDVPKAGSGLIHVRLPQPRPLEILRVFRGFLRNQLWGRLMREVAASRGSQRMPNLPEFSKQLSSLSFRMIPIDVVL